MLLLSILVFISLRKFLIKTWSMTLSWNFSPSTMTIIWRFISHISCKFLSCFLFFHILHLFGLDLLLSLSPHIISSAQFIVLVRLFIKISNCDTEFFFQFRLHFSLYSLQCFYLFTDFVFKSLIIFIILFRWEYEFILYWTSLRCLLLTSWSSIRYLLMPPLKFF